VVTLDNPRGLNRAVQRFISLVQKKQASFTARFRKFKARCLRRSKTGSAKMDASIVMLTSQVMKNKLPNLYRQTDLSTEVKKTIKNYRFPPDCTGQSDDELQGHYDIWYLSTIKGGLGGHRIPPKALVECIADRLIRQKLNSGSDFDQVYAFIHAYALKTLHYRPHGDPDLPDRALQQTRAYFAQHGGTIARAYYWTHEGFYGSKFGREKIHKRWRHRIARGLDELVPRLARVPPSLRLHDISSEVNMIYQFIGVPAWHPQVKRLRKILAKCPTPRGCHPMAVRLFANERF
jgi:hypothetical protein